MSIETTQYTMRVGQKLDLEQLRHEASEAVYKSRKTQRKVAEELDISPGSVSIALNKADSANVGIQIRIIEHLTDYRLERQIIAEVTSKQ